VLFIYTALFAGAPPMGIATIFGPMASISGLCRTGVPAMERGPMAIAIDRHFIF
jgi:hypothetical protein